MSIKKKWSLPTPPKNKEIEWFPVVRVGRMIPFGYYEDEVDPNILRPIPKELNALEKAKKFLKEFPRDEVANWLTEETGRKISGPGLIKRIKLERRNQRDAENALFYAKKWKEAAETARKLQEERIGGSKTRRIVQE